MGTIWKTISKFNCRLPLYGILIINSQMFHQATNNIKAIHGNKSEWLKPGCQAYPLIKIYKVIISNFFRNNKEIQEF